MKTPNKSANGSNGASPPLHSVFADVEALKQATAAKIDKLKSSTEAASGEVVLQRPLPTWFFRTPTDDANLFSGGTWTDPDTKVQYFVAPSMWNHPQLEGAVRPTLFVPYVTAAADQPAVHGVWGVSTIPGNTYTDSLHGAVLPKSRVVWVRTWAVTSIQRYRFQEAADDYGEPIWLNKTIFELLDIVYPVKRQIQDETHEIIARLEGRRRSGAATPDASADPNS